MLTIKRTSFCYAPLLTQPLHPQPCSLYLQGSGTSFQTILGLYQDIQLEAIWYMDPLSHGLKEGGNPNLPVSKVQHAFSWIMTYDPASPRLSHTMPGQIPVTVSDERH